MNSSTRAPRQWTGKHASWLAVALLALQLGGCVGSDTSPDSSPGNDPACVCAPATALVDPALLAFLSKAKALHNQADLAEQDGDINGALAALDKLALGPRPGGEAPAAEVREVLADTLARSAELRSHSDYPAALRDVRRGLELAPERTHYRGRLMEVLGVVEQREFKRLSAQNDPAAPAAKERALKAFEEAVAIQDDVIQRALGDSPDEP